MLAQDAFEMVNYAQYLHITGANFIIQALCSALTRNLITSPLNFSFSALINDEEWIKNHWYRDTRLPGLAENRVLPRVSLDKGATFQQIAAAGFGIATPGGAWRGASGVGPDPQAGGRS